MRLTAPKAETVNSLPNEATPVTLADARGEDPPPPDDAITKVAPTAVIVTLLPAEIPTVPVIPFKEYNIFFAVILPEKVAPLALIPDGEFNKP